MTAITPAQELIHRIDVLQSILRDENMDAALIVQKTDLFYYTGTTQNGWLYVPADGDAVFMVSKNVDRARAETGLENLIPLMSPKKIPDTLTGLGLKLPDTLGLELDVMPANQYFMFQKIFETAKIADISTRIRRQRAVKSDYEVDCMQKAANLADQVAAMVPVLAKEGMPEVELAGLVEAHARKLGHQGLIKMRMWDNYLFYGHLMAGPSAAVPGALASPTAGQGLHPSIGQGSSFSKLRPNQPLEVDYVFCLNGYLSDHTRIFSMGDLPDDLIQAHETMINIQNTVAGQAKPGVATGNLYDTMVTMAAEAGYADVFMGGAEPRIRFTGHGLGLELDEFPFIAKGQKLELSAGMVLALEPKAVIPGKGVVGIENTWVVTDTGLERLTNFPDGICQI